MRGGGGGGEDGGASYKTCLIFEELDLQDNVILPCYSLFHNSDNFLAKRFDITIFGLEILVRTFSFPPHVTLGLIVDKVVDHPIDYDVADNILNRA